MAQTEPANHSRRPRVATLGRETQGYLFSLDGETDPLPGLEDFVPEAPVVPVGEVADLELERTRRRFSQGA